MTRLFFFSSILISVSSLALQRRYDGACNGSPEWCGLKFDQYTFLGTHNSQAFDLKLQCTDKKDFLYQLACQAIQAIPAIDSCLYNNQPSYSITDQLEHGVRAFDIDTAMLGKELKICHGNNDYTAYGEKLSDFLNSFKTFLQKNPGEVLTLEFGDISGDVKNLGQNLIQQIGDSLGDYLYAHPSQKDKWPTLGEMIQTGKRVAVFMKSSAYGNSKPPAWALNRDAYYTGAWSFTHKFDDPSKVASSIRDFCDKDKDKKWLGCDFEFSIDVSYLKNVLLAQKPKFCIADAASIVNPSILDTVTHCFDKKAIHRVRIDNFKDFSDKARKAVDEINKRNAGKFLYGGSSAQ